MIVRNWQRKFDTMLKRCNFTREEFCERMEITTRHFAYLRKDEGKVADRQYAKICEIFNVPLTYFSDEANFSEDGEAILPRTEYVPVLSEPVNAEMPVTPAVSHLGLQFSYISRLAKNAKSTYLVHLFDDDMAPVAPYNSDVVIDSGIRSPIDGKIFYVNVNGEKLLRYLEVSEGKVIALYDGKKLFRREIGDDDLEILGRAVLVVNEI